LPRGFSENGVLWIFLEGAHFVNQLNMAGASVEFVPTV